MPRLIFMLGAATTLAAVGYATYIFASPRRRMAAKNAEQLATVNLAGLATVQIAPSFRPTGPGSTGAGAKGGFDPASVEFNRNERLVTFRFEQDQSNNMGGYKKNPVLLNVSLFNPALPGDDVLKIGGTTISEFYPPVDEARMTAHFHAQEWLPDVTEGSLLTRAAATNKGRGDNLSNSPPARWLVIHVDAAKHVRVDMYTWQDKYSLDDARALARRVAASVAPSPSLRAFFEAVKTVEARTASKHDRAVENALSRIKACGIQAIKPGETVFSGECAAWLSANRRDLHLARAVGRVPVGAASVEPGWPPKFSVALLAGKPPTLIGPPDFQPAMFHWNSKSNKWQLDGFGEQMYGDEARESPLSAAIAARLSDHSSAYVITFARYDLQFHDDRVAIEDFLAHTRSMQQALRAGTMVRGVKALPDEFGK